MSSTLVRPIGHEDRLSLVDHLDELRSRLVACVAVFFVAFVVCAWQNDTLLGVLNAPYEDATQSSVEKGRGLPGQLEKTQVAIRAIARAQAGLSAALSDPALDLAPATQARLRADQAAAAQAISEMPRTRGNQPVTLRVGEPFVTTLTVAMYFALLFSLPLILYQLYAFVLPAFRPEERRVALPLMAMVPFLFIGGVVFAYFMVLPAAVNFLQNFNTDEFNVLVQARDYYKFAVMAMLSLGILFQMPVGILAVTRLGIVTPRQLRKNRRYALLVIAVVAMLLPGTDPVTMLIAMVPLLLLYELSVLLATLFNHGRSDEEGTGLDRWRQEWGSDDDAEDDEPWAGVDDETFLEDDEAVGGGADPDATDTGDRPA
jgi:sec-independent protein translocase protein TatC